MLLLLLHLLSVGYSSTSQYVPAQPGGKYSPSIPAYTGYYRQFGHKHTAIENTTIYPVIGASGTVYTYLCIRHRSSRNAGQIPSGRYTNESFRGTANNPTNTARYVSGFGGGKVQILMVLGVII